MLQTLKKGDNIMVVAGIIAAIMGMVALIVGGVNSAQNANQQALNTQYQKDTQQQIFSREDTAVQRRVADLKAAGLSPVLAAGQGAQSGSIVQTQAPQMDMSFLKNMGNLGTDNISNIMKQKADVSRTNAEEDLIKLQQENAKMQNKFTAAQIQNVNAQTQKTNVDTLVKSSDYDITQTAGTTSNPQGPAKQVLDFLGKKFFENRRNIEAVKDQQLQKKLLREAENQGW